MRKKGLLLVLSKITAFVIMTVMAMAFVGCKGGNNNSGESEKSFKTKVKIDDIDWNISEEIVDGDREICLNITNNSDLYITYFDIQYTLKNNLSEQEKEDFYNLLYKEYDLDEESEEDREKIRNDMDEITLGATTGKLIEPGNSLTSDDVYMGWLDVRDIDMFNYFDMDIATLKYIYEENVYTVYYDYRSKKYTSKNSTSPAYQWSEYDIGNKIPKFEAVLLERDYDREDYFQCTAYGITEEQFNKYIDDCKAVGYIVDARKDEVFYELWYDAENGDGYDLDLRFDTYNNTLEISVTAPKS